MTEQPNKYARMIRGVSGEQRCWVDVYCVLDAFPTNSAAIDHAIKKLLCAGQRGAKSRAQDLREAIQAIERALQMEQSS